MATHCGVSIKTDKGYETIYCHNDGSPEHMLPVLTKNYNSEALAARLISYGDASFIADKLKPTTSFHTFDSPERGVCIFYHRDRHEPWEDNEPAFYSTKQELTGYFYYTYLWQDGCWTFYKGGKKVSI